MRRISRQRLADMGQDLRDRLSVLELLWAAAAATALATIVVGLVLAALHVTIPNWFAPAEGFAIAALVSGVGYWLERDRRRVDLQEVGSLAIALLDARVVLGDPRRARDTTLRELAIAARAGTGAFLDALAQRDGSGLGDRFGELGEWFEAKTSRYAGRLSPARANRLVDAAFRALRRASNAGNAYERRRIALLEAEFRHDVEVRRAQLKALADDLAAPLLEAADAAQDLAEILDRKAARATAAARQLVVDERLSKQRELQARAARTARDMVVAIFGSETAEIPVDQLTPESLEEFRHRAAKAQQEFWAAFRDRGLEMHTATHRAWVDVNDGVNGVANNAQYLGETLRRIRDAGDKKAKALGLIDQRTHQQADLGQAVKWLRERFERLNRIVV